MKGQRWRRERLERLRQHQQNSSYERIKLTRCCDARIESILLDVNEKKNELQKLKGIGEVLSRRLVESSCDTIAKVAGAEKKGLERIAVMNPQKVRSIVTQAREMVRDLKKAGTPG